MGLAYECCGRCGKLFVRPFTPDIEVKKYIHPYGEEIEYILCDDCLKQLEKWLEGGKDTNTFDPKPIKPYSASDISGQNNTMSFKCRNEHTFKTYKYNTKFRSIEIITAVCPFCGDEEAILYDENA